jgi:hypothetical protein
MKKISSVVIAIVLLISIFTKPAAAAQMASTSRSLAAQEQEWGQLKICKSAGPGVTVGQLFTINVNNTSYNVPAGPTDGGYCVLAGQFPLNTDITVQEVIPAGYDVWGIEVKPERRAVDTDLNAGKVIVEIGTGVTEVIFTNMASGFPTPTAGPSDTPTATPVCDPNCPPTSTPKPNGRMQICKEADGAGVSGYFEFDYLNRSKTVPVGACSALITVEAGTLTIHEVAQAGYKVSDIYTIPANRLISKNLNAGSATVTIVQGNVSTQTIIIFRNRAETQNVTPTNTPTGTITPPTPTPTGTITPPTSTPTGTITPPTPTLTGTVTPPTATPTGSVTPPVCTPVVVTADFSQIMPGNSVEGMGAVAPNLNIDADASPNATAVKIAQSIPPVLYNATGSGTLISNGGISPTGGFSDVVTQLAGQAHRYTFTFAPGVTASNFSLHMLDFGDLNPTLNTNHSVTMTAYNASNIIITRHELSYLTLAEILPGSSNIYGNLQITGDAHSGLPGQPGNWTWNLFGSGISKVVLEFGVGFDPNLGFDSLSYTTECVLSCQAPVVPDFGQIPTGGSVEGLGVVAPNLNIDADASPNATAVRIAEGAPPTLYFATGSGTLVLNGGIAPSGGFSDLTTQLAGQAHRYTFTFTPGVTVTNFVLQMLDFGDLNPTLSTNHLVTLTAYDTSNAIVTRQQLSYTTQAESLPTTSNIYGNLQITGDAHSGVPGQPGNWTWDVSGNGIVRIVLEFGAGYDPNLGFHLLSFCPQLP